MNFDAISSPVQPTSCKTCKKHSFAIRQKSHAQLFQIKGGMSSEDSALSSSEEENQFVDNAPNFGNELRKGTLAKRNSQMVNS